MRNPKHTSGATGDAAPIKLSRAIFLCNLSNDDINEMKEAFEESLKLANLLEELILELIYEEQAQQTTIDSPPDYIAYYIRLVY